MSGNSVALDTSIAIDVLADRAESFTSQPITEFLLPVPVVGELRYGARNSRRAEENLAEVERLVARCRVMDITLVTAEVYARLRLDLKKKGKPIPENDLWIAATALALDATLVSRDSDFQAVEGLCVVGP